MTIHVNDPMGWLSLISGFLFTLLTGVFFIFRHFYLESNKKLERLEAFKNQYYENLAETKLREEFIRSKEPLMKKYIHVVEQMELFGIKEWIKLNLNK